VTNHDIAESTLFPPIDTCPGCRAHGLQAISAGDQVNFYCPLCDRCWHVDLGYVHEVDHAVDPIGHRGGAGATCR
jgi:hypothetical protein